MPTLDWLSRDAAFRIAERVPTRLLRPHRAGAAFGDEAASANWLIQGDNLDALKALLPFHRGRVKCIFIDPPYNTKSAFEHYDDNLEHAQWLTMMLPRLQLLRELLSEDGSIWVTIDDNEGHYLKVLMDEVFGRANFVANVIWEKSDSPKMDSQYFSSRHDHILVFAQSLASLVLNRVSVGAQEHYGKVDDAGRRYYTKPLRAMGSGEDTREARPTMYFSMTAPDGTSVFPRKRDGVDGRWRWGLEKIAAEASRIEWVNGRNGWAPYYRIYEEASTGRPLETIWTHLVAGSNRTSKLEVKVLFGDEKSFTTPKPESVVQLVLSAATNPGDLVLDSFLGSGTTAAVAHKMGRRWIGIEMGEHAVTHCLPRLRKVVKGEQGGISKAVNWNGGGGFRFFSLGAPMFDAAGEIDASVRFADLAAFIWLRETGSPLASAAATRSSPWLGTYASEPGSAGTAYYLLFNGILGDRRPAGGNVLTSAVLAALRSTCWHEGPKVVYGEACRLGDARLAAESIAFKQLPYAVPR